jgi:hypothetical protein
MFPSGAVNPEGPRPSEARAGRRPHNRHRAGWLQRLVPRARAARCSRVAPQVSVEPPRRGEQGLRVAQRTPVGQTPAARVARAVPLKALLVAQRPSRVGNRQPGEPHPGEPHPGELLQRVEPCPRAAHEQPEARRQQARAARQPSARARFHSPALAPLLRELPLIGARVTNGANGPTARQSFTTTSGVPVPASSAFGRTSPTNSALLPRIRAAAASSHIRTSHIRPVWR